MDWIATCTMIDAKNAGKMQTWSVERGRVVFHAGRGSARYPSAHEIWSLVFQGASSIGGVELDQSPADALPNLSFSRFPADVVLRVSGALKRGIRLDFAAKVDDAVVTLEPSGDGGWPDQIIVGDSWYPLDPATVACAIDALRRDAIEPGARISLGQLIRLRCNPELPIDVVEQADVSASTTGHEAAAGDVLVEGLNAQLYPYQKDGVAFLRLVAKEGLGCILGDEMGLGKTLQVIALIQAEANAHRAPALVIAPATLLENWRRELALFAPQLSVLVHAGPNRPGQAGKLTSFDVVVTSYETAVRDEPMLSSVSWNVLAVDEAQSIRNPEAQRTLAIKRLPRRVSLAVTGTPVENRLADLWSLSDFALPGLLGGVADFHAEYDDNATDASRLAVVVAPILLRRRVSEVAKDLPPRIDIPQCIMMTRALAGIYEEVRKEAEAEYGPAAGLVSLQKLRMFCSHPMLVDRWENDPANGMPKFQRLLEILEEVFARGEKALVFCSYTKMADILLDHFLKTFPNGFFQCIDGRTAIADRQPTVDGFSEFAGYGALVLNPKAAGVGLNITAANHVIHYNPEWNPAVEDQASARAYRRKQTRSVTVHHLYFGDTVEDVMVARLNFKRSLAGAAVTGHTGDATSEDVLRALAISPMSKISSLE